MTISEILKNKIKIAPVSARYIKTVNVEKFLINPVKKADSFNEKEKEKIELWLAYCAIGIQLLETGTKMLSHMNVIHDRSAVYDLITAFKQLNKHFSGNENFDKKSIDTDDFIFNFLTSTNEEQKRVIKFQESILKKNKNE